MNYYPHHIGDFNNATRHLTRLERSIYRDLIELYYELESELPADINRLARRILANTEDELIALKLVLDEFFTGTDRGWFHNRCDEEISKYRDKADKASKAGKASAARRTPAEPKGNGNPTDDQQALNGRSTDDQLTNNQEPITNKTTTAAIIPPVVAPPDEKTPPPPIAGKPEKPEPPPKTEIARNVQIAVLLRGWERDRGKFAKITSATPQLQGWIAKGATDEQIREAYDLAVGKRKADGDDGAVNAGIVDTFLAQILNPPAATSAVNRPPAAALPWQASWSGIVAKGQELGLHQSEAEHPQAFKARVFAAVQMTPEEKAILRADYGVHA